MATPTHRYDTYIRCPCDAVWEAIVDGDQTQQYFYGTRFEADLEPDAPLRYFGSDGALVADGQILALEPGRRLEMWFHPRWDPMLEANGAVRMAWLVQPFGGLTKVTVEYYDLSGLTSAHFEEGIPLIVAGLKTLLETGEPLNR